MSLAAKRAEKRTEAQLAAAKQDAVGEIARSLDRLDAYEEAVPRAMRLLMEFVIEHRDERVQNALAILSGIGGAR